MISLLISILYLNHKPNNNKIDINETNLLNNKGAVINTNLNDIEIQEEVEYIQATEDNSEEVIISNNTGIKDPIDDIEE